MITAVERAIITRLQAGLGRMVRQVDSYSGELDDDLASVIRAFPAVWVTFGGISDTRPTSTSRSQQKASAQFVVMVGERHLVQQAGRQGGSLPGQVGSNQLVQAVRRLLSGQDLALAISPLQAGKVRTLYNTRLNADAFSVFACEFTTSWVEDILPGGHWPEVTTPDSPDTIFGQFGGQLQSPAPAWLRTGLSYYLAPDDGQPDAQDLINRSEA